MELSTRQKELVKEISQANIKSVRVIAAGLVEIRSIFKEEQNWSEFVSSKVLGFSEKTCYDYCAAEPWLRTTGVDDEVLGKLSVRSMAWIAQLQETDADRFNELEKRLLKGEVLTQSDIRPPKEAEPKQTKKELIEKVSKQAEVIRLLSSDAERLTSARDFWMKRARELERKHEEAHVEYQETVPGWIDELLGSGKIDPLPKKARKQLASR